MVQYAYKKFSQFGFLHVDGITFQNVNQASVTIADVLWFPHSTRVLLGLHRLIYIFKCIKTAPNATEIIVYGLRAPSNITLENKSSWTVFSFIICFRNKESLRLSELCIKRSLKRNSLFIQYFVKVHLVQGYLFLSAFC